MKKKIRQNVILDIPICNLAYTWKGNFEKLPANQTYDLILDYPFGGNRVHHFTIKTGRRGLSLIFLLSKIGKAYNKIYEDPDTNGVFGHDIYDLSLEGISINHKNKTIKLEVGS